MQSRRQTAFAGALAAFLLLTVFVLTFLRLFYGAETTDETLAVGDAYLVTQGGLPLINMWSQFATVSFIVAPILKIFLWLTGGTTGVMLYMRLMFFASKLLLIALLCLLLRKKVSIRLLLLSSAFILPLDYCNLQNFTYTIVSIHCLLAASACMAAALLENTYTRKGLLCACAGGFFAALCAAAYPPQAITCVLLAAGLLALERRLRHSCRFTLCFAGTGLCLALVLTLFLILRGGGMAPLIDGIKSVLFVNPYLKLKTTSTLSLLSSQLRAVIRELVPWAAMLILLLGGSLLAGFLAVHTVWKEKRFPVKACILLSFGLSYAAFLVYSFWKRYPTVLAGDWPGRSSMEGIIRTICIPAVIMVPMLFLLVKERHPESRVLFPVFWLPPCVWLAVAAFLTRDGFTIRCVALISCEFLFLLFSGWLIEDLLPGGLLALFGQTALSAFICALSVGILWGFVYRDSSTSALRCRVPEGIYKGLYTTEERALGLMSVEKELQSYINTADSVLFLDTTPFAYLMVEAEPCTPSTWDFSAYTYGLNDDMWYQRYFQVTGQTPDQIVYLHTGRDDHVSIEEPGYHFNDFVNQYYQLTYENKDLYFPIKVYTRQA